MTLEELKESCGTSSFVEMELSDMIKELGEDQVKTILSTFSCPLNKDVENFLKEKAILFSKRDFSKTTLVYWVSGDKNIKELVGYYTVAEKVIQLDQNVLTSKERRKLHGHGTYHPETRTYFLPAPLIAQLGKNYSNGNDTLISGTDLLQLAMEKIKLIKNIIGGRFVYLECEDVAKLVDFYTENNFKCFGKRELDADETDIRGTYLLQLFTIL
ncbi:MAG: N-acetyltransferase [Lachnospiraceae bacterium]|nr:N-acetyltransferase [Lachnospiraceae bacterium]